MGKLAEPGPARQQCHFWLPPHSLLTWILTQNLLSNRKPPGTATLHFSKCCCSTRRAASHVDPCGEMAAPGGLGLGHVFFAKGLFPWLHACWACGSRWAHLASYPSLQKHSSISELLQAGWPLTIGSSKLEDLVLDFYPVNRGWQTHPNLTRV